jgi:glycosyltransferase involved in cell wall biosynthesis
MKIVSMPEIQIFITTYNRPAMVFNAVNSTLNQDFDSFEVILSDNSSNDETENQIYSIKSDRFVYKRRKQPLSAIDHLNAVLQEVTAAYFMIFHDDDVMHRNLIKVLYTLMSENKDVIAVGSNANVFKEGKDLKRKFNNRLKNDIKINSTEEMVHAYSIPSFVPFPGYMYRKEVAQKLRFDNRQGGKHSDVAFIINLMSLGSVIFVAKPYMDYYKHSEQDSVIYDFRAFSSLISYISKTLNLHRKNSVLRRMRIQNIYMEAKYCLLNQKFSIFSRRYIRLAGILFHYSVSEYFVKIILVTFYSLLVKIERLFFKNH